MKMKSLALACSAALLGVSATAQAELSGNIGVTSNYMFRGATLSGDEAAVSGGLDWAHESGFYVGTWASSLGSANDTEVDLYLGFGGEAAGLGYDVGVLRYNYLDTEDIDYTEVYGSISWEPLELGVAYTVESESANDGGPYDEGDVYVYGTASFPIMNGFSAGGTLGYYEFDNDGTGANTDFSYGHLDLFVGKSVGDFGDFTFSVSFRDGGDNYSDGEDTKVWAAWTKTF